MAITALPGVDTRAVISGFDSLRQARTDKAKMGLAKTELDESLRMSQARRGILGQESDINKARLTQLKKDLSGTDEVKRDMAIDFLYSGVISRQMKQQLDIAGQENQFARLQLSLMGEQRQREAAVQRNIETEVGAIYDSSMPPELKIQYGRELKRSLTAQSTGQFDPTQMRQPSDIYESVREGVEEGRRQTLAEEVAKESRAAETRSAQISQTTTAQIENTDDYEEGSLREVEEAVANRALGVLRDGKPIAVPEVRYVLYDPPGWMDPKNRKGMKLMTERRAMELGLQDEWQAAGASNVNGQSPKPAKLNDAKVKALLNQ